MAVNGVRQACAVRLIEKQIILEILVSPNRPLKDSANATNLFQQVLMNLNRQ